MARTYPKTLPDAENAWHTLFKQLGEHLDSSYHIYHNSLLKTALPAEQHDGAPAVLIAHPLHGVLALMDEHTTHDALFALQTYLNTHADTRSLNWVIHSVPIPTDIVAGSLQRNIEALFAAQQRADLMPPYQQGIQALRLALLPTHYLHTALAANFETAEQRIKELTDEQAVTFEQLVAAQDKPRQLVRGVAGSGKTLIAAAVAERLARMGKKVLYTCYNRNLAEWLIDTGLGSTLMVRHFHALCGELSRHPPLTAAMRSSGISSDQYHNMLLPNALFEAAKQDPNLRFDAVIVDEGQDFRQTFWPPLLALLRDPQSSLLYVFCDDNQRIYTRDEIPVDTEPLYLSRNLRNVRPIGETVRKYHRGIGSYEVAGPDSTQAIEYVDPAQHDGNLDLALEHTLNRLTGQGIPLDRMVLLTPFSDKSRWKDGMIIGKYRLRWGISTKSKNGLCVETIFAFKGLERPVVILSELNRAYHAMRQNFDELCYVGYSRAKHYLVILQAPPNNV